MAKLTVKPKGRKPARTGHREVTQQTNLIDDVRDFEVFRNQFPAALRKDLLSGKNSEQLRNKYSAMIQTRILNIALTDPDSGKALAAAKDVLDRKDGKAIERREEKHLMANLPEEQIEAALHAAFEKAYGNDED